MKKMIELIPIIIMLIIVPLASAAIHRVPSEYPTIRDAVYAYACKEGDTVLIAPGIYTGDGNRDIYVRKSITIKSEQGPLTCIIDCQGAELEPPHRGFNFRGGDEVNAILEGITITKASGGISSYNFNITIRNCVIAANTARGDGGGIFIVSGSQQDVSVINCIITGNICRGGSQKTYGGGIFCMGMGDIIFRNCIISGNKADFGGGVAWTSPDVARFENCIISDNVAVLARGSQAYAGRAGGMIPRGGTSYPVGDVVFAYCYIDDDPNAFYYEKPFTLAPDEVFSLDNCLRTNPEFARDGFWDPNRTLNDPNDDFWVEADYHLKSQAGRWDPNSQSWIQDDVTSPCIDAGDMSSPIGFEPFPNGGVINMGAYGGTAEASKSYFGEPVCETIIAGDINGDCKVDFADFSIMAAHWLEKR